MFLDVMSDLKNLTLKLDNKEKLEGRDFLTMRDKLVRVFHGMASNLTKTSRGCRELGRRFVPLEHSVALFKNKPSHHCLFGERAWKRLLV